MNKTLKIALGVLGALAVLLAGVAAFVASRFDADGLKALAIERVQHDYQRTLAMPGPLKLSFWPRLGVKVGEVSLSEHGGPGRFASLRAANVSLELWPLVHGQVVADRVRIEGLSAALTRQADGRLSIDDLLGTPPDKRSRPASPRYGIGPPMALEIAGISLVDATLRLDDKQAQRQIELTQATLETGRITPGQPAEVSFNGRFRNSAPSADLTLVFSARVTFDATQITASGVRAQAEGRLLDWPQSKLGLKVAQFERRAATLTAQKIELDAALGSGQGEPLHARLTADIEGSAARLWMPRLDLQATLPNPNGGKLSLNAQGQASLRSAPEGADLQLNGSFDGSRFTLKVGVDDFSPLATQFDIDIDKLDFDRFRTASAAEKSTSAPATAAAGAGKPIELFALTQLHTRGSLRIGSLRVAGLQIGNLRASLRAADGRAELAPLQAQLYQGRMAGKLALEGRGAPRISLAQSFSDVQLGPLLKDLLGKAPIEGQGHVTLDLVAQGATLAALRESLAGRARLELRDGAVHGINVAQALRAAKARLGLAGGAQGGPSSTADRTDFSELSGSFVIQHGVAHNDDLLARSALLRVRGNGDIDLAHERLDYTVKATLQGQDGPELQALNGQTIPVHLSGPFTSIGYKVDFAGVLQDLARSKVGERAKDQLQDKLKKLFGR
jgi:AsmA protein